MISTNPCGMNSNVFSYPLYFSPPIIPTFAPYVHVDKDIRIWIQNSRGKFSCYLFRDKEFKRI